MDNKDIAKRLADCFEPLEIEWRVQQAGETNGKKWALVLAYVTNRAIMERLDDVFGIGGWQNEYKPLPDGGIICGISAKIESGPQEFEWVTKYDGADKTHIEATKGGLSNAMKRAGVQWGIGRYLYRLETTFVTLLTKDEKKAGGDYITAVVKLNKDDKFPQKFFFERPKLPNWALPEDLKK